MAAQKQSLPSFASILSVLSIVLYCAGFLRVELELNEQKKRINTLESVAETKPSHYVYVYLVKLTKNAQGNFVLGITTSFGVIYNSYINKSYNSWVQKDISMSKD